MAAEIIVCEQNSPQWLEARRGIPTASMFATVMAKGVGGKGPSLTRATYMRKLAGEIITGEPMENFSNAHMERGHAMEGEARDFYSFITDADRSLSASSAMETSAARRIRSSARAAFSKSRLRCLTS